MEKTIIIEILIFTGGLILGIFITLLFSYIIKKNKQDNTKELEKLKAEHELQIRKEGELTATVKLLNEAITKKEEEFTKRAQEREKFLQNEFKLLSENILKDNTAEFKKSSTENISNLLNPFKDQLEKFNKEAKDSRENKLKNQALYKNKYVF